MKVYQSQIDSKIYADTGVNKSAFIRGSLHFQLTGRTLQNDTECLNI